MSSLFDFINGTQPAPAQNPMMGGNPFLSQLQQFAGAVNGNPEQIVQGLLQNGKMSQEQFEQLKQKASQIQQMFGLN